MATIIEEGAPQKGRRVVARSDEEAQLIANELYRSGERDFQVHVGAPAPEGGEARIEPEPAGKFMGLSPETNLPKVAGPGGVMLDASAAMRGGAGVAMAYLEMLKGLAQLVPKSGKPVVDWVNEQERKFWQSKEAGGFFGDPWAEAGRAAAHAVTGVAGAKGIQTLLPKLLGGLPGVGAARIANSYTGQVGTAGAAGAALGAAQPAGEDESKAMQALSSALVAMGLQGAVGAIPTIKDMVKQHVGASGQGWLAQILPFNAKTVTTSNPRIDMQKVREGNMLEMETGTPLTMGQKLGDQEILNREMIVNTQPRGIEFHQDLARRQAQGVEGTVRRGMVGGPTPADQIPQMDQALRLLTKRGTTPTDVQRVMEHLDATDPNTAMAIRQRYVENLISKGEIPLDSFRGPGLTNPRASFSVSAFGAGRPARDLDFALYSSILRPQDRAWVEKAYELASKTASHELNPRIAHGSELARAAQAAQAATGVLTAPGGAGPIFAMRSRAFTELPNKWRYYLMTKEGQEELVRLTNWERGIPGLMAPAAATTGAATVRTSGRPEEEY